MEPEHLNGSTSGSRQRGHHLLVRATARKSRHSGGQARFVQPRPANWDRKRERGCWRNALLGRLRPSRPAKREGTYTRNPLGLIPDPPFILGARPHERCRNQGGTRKSRWFHTLVPGPVTAPVPLAVAWRAECCSNTGTWRSFDLATQVKWACCRIPLVTRCRPTEFQGWRRLCSGCGQQRARLDLAENHFHC